MALYAQLVHHPIHKNHEMHPKSSKKIIKLLVVVFDYIIRNTNSSFRKIFVLNARPFQQLKPRPSNGIFLSRATFAFAFLSFNNPGVFGLR
ncbi:hypothetical protein GIB67_019608 [Kingdonia uniflora]|uniref:Uncharacterized protein n=1 Tax=Kingdonia uniflora TaxID=39325 RepID=A0A7J7N158_9MAGN|nr:hypothetical protein GIB67_019608 [Kingdonia uniflora]